MSSRSLAMISLCLLLFVLVASGQDVPPPGDNKPLLRLEAGGPTSNVTALAMSADGNTLYAAGFDKVVRVWVRNPKTGRFSLDDQRYFRVPLNPGTSGAINALALSPDGERLAVGGLGVVRVAAGFFDTGRLWPTGSLRPEAREDMGLIYVFSTLRQEVRMLRGHTGPIVGLTFAPERKGLPPVLVSAAKGWDAKRGEETGEVRVWNVNEGASLGQLTALPPPLANGRLPGLAVVPTGAKLKDLRVALAWGDSHKGADGTRGELRFWDLDGEVHSAETGFANTALALLPDRSTVLNGNFLKTAGQLQEWDASTNPPKLKAGRTAALPSPADGYDFPETLAPVSTKSAINAAVVVRRLAKMTGEVENRLLLIDLQAGQFGTVKAQTSLWKDKNVAPVLAAGGGYVAVAGNEQHTIHVYAIADLLKGKPEPQLLRSAGAIMRQVSFATREQKGKKRVGLLMSEEPNAKGNLILDFESRTLTKEIKGWSSAESSVDWKIQQGEQGGPKSLRVFDGQKQVAAIQVPAAQRVDHVAYLPAQAPQNVAVVVVGGYVQRGGVPILDVYVAKTGKHVRRFTGHTAPITALALSADGGLLASAANDQTVAVWSLTDLDEIVGRFGGLSGVTVEERAKKVVVAKVDDDSPAKDSLLADTIIEGFVGAGGKFRPLKSTHDFYDAFWTSKPGNKLTVRIAAGRDKKDTALTVDQGIDERKPLFTLFVSRAKKDGERDWVGWNGMGPFDASGPAAERYVGWHFNTGDAKEPTKFAQLAKYREEFFKRDILKHLVAEASLSKAIEKQKGAPPPPRPAPQFSAAIGAALGPGGEIVARQRKAAIKLAIHDFTPEAEDVVEWQFDTGKPQALAGPDGNLWTIALPELSAKGLVHRVRITIRLHEPGKQAAVHEKEMTIRYLPPAPRLELAGKSNYEAAESDTFLMKALLYTEGDGPGVKLTLWHNDLENPRELWELPRSAKPQEITRKIALKAGDNLVKIAAYNDGFEDDEGSIVAVKVTYKPKAPTIAVEKIEPAVGEAKPFRFEPDQEVIVDVPAVRIHGIINAAKLASAVWTMDPKREKQNLDPQPRKKDVAFVQEVKLQPGKQTVHFFAKSADSADGTETVKILYRPQLPSLVLKAPDPVLKEPGDKNKMEITLAGTLAPPALPSPAAFKLQATVYVNGEKAIGPIALDSTAAALPESKLTLRPGSNQVKVVLNHAWGGNPVVAEYQVRYVRPPRITSVKATPVDSLPFVHVRAEVISPLKPLVETLKILVDDQEQRFADAKISAGPNDRTWIVEVQEIPLIVTPGKAESENKIALLVSNAEEQSLPSTPELVKYKEPPPPPPDIYVVSPTSSQVRLNDPELEIVFQVKSAKPPKRVEVSRDSKVLYSAAKMIEKDTGLYEFATGKLKLDWGLNQLKVEAVNDGGPASKALTLSIPPWPVDVVIDSIRADGPKGKPFDAEILAGGKKRFAKAPDGKVLLEGKVRWSSKDDALFAKAQKVRVYINGFQQVPVDLLPAKAGARERQFQARLILNLPENNIEVDLPGLKLEGSNHRECEALCQKPITGQHLHIVLLAPDMKEDKDLLDGMARALKAKRKGPGLCDSETIFKTVHLHKKTGAVRLLDVFSLLDDVRDLLDERARQGSPNDVVMIYFLGRETVTDQGRFLWTSESRPGPNRPTKALAINEVTANYFARFPGAQVLFLDLGAEKGKNSALEEDLRLAVFRHIQPPESKQPQLLGGLEAGMPKTKYLDQLPTFLQNRFSPDEFVWRFPPGLRMQINPEADAP